MDPITISAAVVSTTFLVEGVKFLWKQADTIVNRYQQRKYEQIEAEKQVVVEVDSLPEVMEALPAMTIDFERAKEKGAKLALLSEDLEPYAKGEKMPDSNDRALVETMDALQKMIEYVYHHRFQIKEERRQAIIEATGGGRVEIEDSRQTVSSNGRAAIRADGRGSEVKIGKSVQRISSTRPEGENK